MFNYHAKCIVKAMLFFLFLLSINSLYGQGTYPVQPGTQVDEDVELLGALGNRLIYFDMVNGNQTLWVSDATSSGTYQIGDSNQEDISLIAMTADKWYFEETIGGIYHISELSSGSDNLVSLYNTDEGIERSLLWNGGIYFTVDSPTSFAGDDLVKLDLSNATTEILFTSDFGGIRGIGATDSEVMFVASMDAGKMLGKTDGTLSNTSTFHMLYPAGGEFANSVFMESDGDKMFFAYHPNNDPYNLWVSDGTSGGTMILKEYDSPSFGTPDRPFAFLDGKFYFILREADSPSGTTFELHVSDGTVNGTFNLNPNSSGYLHPRQLSVFNNKIYFNSLDNNWALMATNGTVAGTETIIQPYGYQSGGIGQVYENGFYNNQLVLQARSADHGSEIFISDGTLAGTTLLADVVPGEDGSSPSQFIQVGDLLYFIAEIDNDTYLYVYDSNFMPCAGFVVDSVMVTNMVDATPGSIEVVVSGGTEPYSFQLDGQPSTNNPLFENLDAGTYTIQITDGNGCPLEIEVVVDMETKILNHSLINSFSVSPNPILSENLNLKMSFTNSIETIEIQIFDMNGRKVFQKNNIEVIGNELNQMIPTDNYSNGTYSIFIYSKNKRLVVDKFVVASKK